MTIRIGIMGYGNLGRGIENAIHDNPDMQLQAVFTRRNPDNVKIRTAGVPVVEAKDIEKSPGACPLDNGSGPPFQL